MTRKLALFILAIFALLAVPMAADLIISFTVVPIVLADVIELSIVATDTPGELQAVLTYQMKLNTGEDYERGSHRFVLNGPETTAVLSFLNGSAIPKANAAEGIQ